MFSRLKGIMKDLLLTRGTADVARIRVSGRDTFDYVLGTRRATIYAELLTGPINRSICVWSIRKWHPPHEDELMTGKDKTEILACLQKYFDKKHISYDFVDGDPTEANAIK